MNKKMNAVKEIEKRLNKLLKEYDFYQMQKELKEKANQIDIQKFSHIVDIKINSGQDQISYLKE